MHRVWFIHLEALHLHDCMASYIKRLHWDTEYSDRARAHNNCYTGFVVTHTVWFIHLEALHLHDCIASYIKRLHWDTEYSDHELISSKQDEVDISDQFIDSCQLLCTKIPRMRIILIIWRQVFFQLTYNLRRLWRFSIMSMAHLGIMKHSYHDQLLKDVLPSHSHQAQAAGSYIDHS